MFTGYDISEDMVAAARKVHQTDPASDWMQAAVPREAADYVVASGIFNTRGGTSHADWQEYIYETVEAMAGASRIGFGFNMLTTHNDLKKRRDDLHYVEPAPIFTYCVTKYSRQVALLQDYGLYEFTVLVRLA
jgi:hypothetical protein